MLLIMLFPSSMSHTVGFTAFMFLIPASSIDGREGSSFSGLVPSNDIIVSESVVVVKPDYSGVLIGLSS